MNKTLIFLSVNGIYDSPFYTGNFGSLNIKKSFFESSFHSVFYGSDLFRIVQTTFKEFLSTPIIHVTRENVYSGDFYQRIHDFSALNTSLLLKERNFITCKSNETGGVLYVLGTSKSIVLEITETKLYQCSSKSGVCFYIVNTHTSINKTCATECFATYGSHISLKGDANLSISDTFIKDDVSSSDNNACLYLSAKTINVAYVNMSSDYSTSAERSLIISSNGEVCVKYLTVARWKCNNLLRFTLNTIVHDDATVQYVNLIHIISMVSLIEVSCNIVFSFIYTQNIVTGCNFTLISNEDYIVKLENSTFDKADINTSFVKIDNPEHDKDQEPNNISLNYGPKCYEIRPTATDLPVKHESVTPFVLILFSVLLFSVFFSLFIDKSSTNRSYEDIREDAELDQTHGYDEIRIVA